MQLGRLSAKFWLLAASLLKNVALLLCNWHLILMGSALTCSLVPFLEPNYVAGGSLTSNRRRRLWGDHPRQKF